MSVFKRKGQTIYSYDFQIDGRRFTRSAETANREQAKKIETVAKEKAKADIAEEKAKAAGPMTIEIATGRYWSEVGQHHANSSTTLTNLLRLQTYFGKTKRLDDIGDDDLTKLVAWRRAQTVRGRRTIKDPARKGKTRPAPLVSPATVNRSTTELLEAIFKRAKKLWSATLPQEPDWGEHLLKEAGERVREVKVGEEKIVEGAIRADYMPLVDFARASGLRMANCMLRKDEVDLIAGRIRTIGKGGKPIDKPITSEMRAILMEAMANPTDYVFTYAAARAKKGKGGHKKGDRLPITKSGLKTLWRRSKHRKKGPRLPADLRFHDLRHDFATKLLRETKNLKLVQRALDHSKIETTTKYAHVLDEEVAAGMEAAIQQRKRAKNTP